MRTDITQASRNDPTSRDTLVAAVLGVLASLATGAACVGPFVALLLGVGGLGWLTQYAYLRVPATILTALVLLAGFARAYGPTARRCAAVDPRRGRGARVLLWSATLLALAIHLFEYVVLPRLG